MLGAPLLFAACTGPTDSTDNGDRDAISGPDDGAGDPAAGTRPSGQPNLVNYEGRIEQGVECQVLATPDGARYAFTPQDGFAPGDYVSVGAEMADASFCQEGDGTIIIDTIRRVSPPARDRDPARAGGIALDEDYVVGDWTAKGANADCARPDFQVSKGPGALVLESAVNGVPTDVRVALGGYPRLDLDQPLPDLPIESRGPDGLAILRPATDAQYDPVSIGGEQIAGDGVVFVKCAD